MPDASAHCKRSAPGLQRGRARRTVRIVLSPAGMSSATPPCTAGRTTTGVEPPNEAGEVGALLFRLTACQNRNKPHMLWRVKNEGEPDKARLALGLAGKEFGIDLEKSTVALCFLGGGRRQGANASCETGGKRLKRLKTAMGSYWKKLAWIWVWRHVGLGLAPCPFGVGPGRARRRPRLAPRPVLTNSGASADRAGDLSAPDVFSAGDAAQIPKP